MCEDPSIMNCPSRTDPIIGDGHNQNPSELAVDLTTNSDSGRVAYARTLWDHRTSNDQGPTQASSIPHNESIPEKGIHDMAKDRARISASLCFHPSISATISRDDMPSPPPAVSQSWPREVGNVLRTYLKFVGPGMMISVAYIDPGNYATDVSAGATYRFKLLFVILLSNIFAVSLQSLCIKLGTVTGLSMPQMIRAHWPSWLNRLWLFLSMAAIAATDVAEVIGTAIAINLLSSRRIPVTGASALCLADVIFILIFYRSSTASIRARRVFEFFVALLVIGVAVCFCIQLTYLDGFTAGDVFDGFVPSSELVQRLGLYLGCGIVGATVMPHSLILGSGLVQDRLVEFDQKHNLVPEPESYTDNKRATYRPSLRAIRHCISYSIADNCISLLTFALFINSAILIVAGSSLSNVDGAANASLFGIYDLLGRTLGRAVANMFAVALLLSGLSAGIVVTMAGQVAVEGHLNIRLTPWKVRLIIRLISVPISVAVAATLGAHGLNTVLVASQVTLCVLLPCISLPLIWFTCQSKYMTVTTDARGRRRSTPTGSPDEATESGVNANSNVQGNIVIGGGSPETTTGRSVNMRNNYFTSAFMILIWLVISMMNVAMIVLIGTGRA